MLPFLLEICTTTLVKWVEEYISAKGLSFAGDLGKVATGCDVNQVAKIIETGTANSMEWASRQGLQFNIAKTEMALLKS